MHYMEKVIASPQGNKNESRSDERKRAEKVIRSRTDELSTLYALSRSLAEVNDLKKILDLVNRCTVESVRITFARIALSEGSELVIHSAYPIRFIDHDFLIGNHVPLSSLPFCQHTLEKNEIVILSSKDVELSNKEREELLLNFAKTLCLVPLRVGNSIQNSDRIIGLLMLGEERSESREPFTEEKIRLVRSIGDQAAIAIHRTQLYDQTVRHLRHLTLLREIDKVIISSFDLQGNLEKILTHIKEQMGVDAVDVLLFDSSMDILEYKAGIGFRSENIERLRQGLGMGCAESAVFEGKMVHIPDITSVHYYLQFRSFLSSEDFVSYFGVPLVIKGQVKGIIEVFQRIRFDPDEEWIDFLNALAGQAAIAIDNATLFNNLQHSNSELTLAYNSTIEGWSHALDLRDNETDGHTKRVTDRTIKLAQLFNFNDNEIMQIRWGTLLHDIGKMGVPDGILFKPSALTEEEWMVMRKHPTFAYEMLSDIGYLRSALDIPYCHHEKWDGSGYPRGLKGEQIPLAARIFAVVDVWDALKSPRPYRSALDMEKVYEHIKSQSGIHFDPQVVDICFKSNILK
jgi:GAF domain-containing protein